MAEVILRRKLTEMNHCSSSSKMANNMLQQPPTKTERKVIEKNRRNQMKNLFSILNSLIPKHPSKEALPLPDQIDEAISYIKNMEARLNKLKEKKETLATKKRPFSSICTNFNAASAPAIKAPKIEIRDMGFSLEIILINGLENNFIFTEVIRILHEENVDIISTNSSVAGDSVLHVVHSQMNELLGSSFGATRVTERLNRFINGSTSELELELEPELWDFNEIQPELWTF